MEKLTLDLLEKKGACKEGIEFVVRNGLEGYPLDRLDEIEGDYKGYMNWLSAPVENCIKYYDDSGNVIKKIMPKGYELYQVDVSTGAMTKRTGISFDYEYDDLGNMLKQTHSNGDFILYDVDGNGNIVKVTYSNGEVWHYEYDGADNMVKSIYPSGKVYLYEYDGVGNRVKEIYPNGKMKEWSYSRTAGGDFTVRLNNCLLLTVPKF